MKLRIDRNSIKFKTWLNMILFTAFLMVLLWVLQVIFLNNFYEIMKTEQTDKITKNIEKSYMSENTDDFLDEINEISSSNDIYIYIASFDGNTLYFKPSDDISTSNYYSNQIETVNKYLLEDDKDSVSLRIKGLDSTREVLAYGKVLIHKNKTPFIIYVFSPLWPVSSTINILTNQLIYVTIISIILACWMSFYLSARITRPIRRIVDSAQQLGDGEYGVVFKGGRYTEINTLADTLTKTSIDLEKSAMLQRDLIANVSHDLKTPLTMITSYAEMIRDLSGDNPEKRSLHLQVIIDEAERLNGLVGDLLSISKMQSGKLTLDKKEFNLTEAIKSIINTYNIMETNEGFNFNFQSTGDFIVYADEDKVKQVISNLFTNAIKFCGNDKTVNISLKKHGKILICKIEDHGKGIPEKELKHIWERYYKASSNMTRETEGSGLGLSIVKEILSLHNSNFGVNSVLNKGTTFWFELEIIKHIKDTPSIFIKK